MSTRSYIGLLNKDGSVRSIYHHWDGYPECVGKILFDNYEDENKINKLLDLGDMSIIGTEPIGYWSNFGHDDTKCMTYRERGEINVDAKTYKSVQDFLNHCEEDFTYIFMDGEWWYRNWDDDLKPLRTAF